MYDPRSREATHLAEPRTGSLPAIRRRGRPTNWALGSVFSYIVLMRWCIYTVRCMQPTNDTPLIPTPLHAYDTCLSALREEMLARTPAIVWGAHFRRTTKLRDSFRFGSPTWSVRALISFLSEPVVGSHVWVHRSDYFRFPGAGIRVCIGAFTRISCPSTGPRSTETSTGSHRTPAPRRCRSATARAVM